MKLKNNKAKLLNIPFACNFLKVTSEFLKSTDAEASDLIILPTTRACTHFRNLYPNIKAITYSELSTSKKQIQKEHLKILIFKILKKQFKNLEHIEDFYSFVVKYYSFNKSCEPLKHLNQNIYNLLRDLENELSKDSLTAYQELDSSLLEQRKVIAVITNNSSALIKNTIDFLIKKPDSTFIFHGLNRQRCWQTPFKPNDHEYLYQELLQKYSIPIESIIDIGNVENNSLQYAEFQNQYLEADYVADTVIKHLEFNPKARIAVISEDRNKNLILKELFLKHGYILNETAETPLNQSNFWKLLSLILNYAIDPSSKHTLALVKNRFYKHKLSSIEAIEKEKLRGSLSKDSNFEILNAEFIEEISELKNSSSFINIASRHFNILEKYFELEDTENYSEFKRMILESKLAINCTLQSYSTYLKHLIEGLKHRTSELIESRVEITNLIESNLLYYDLVVITEFTAKNYFETKNQKKFLSISQETALGLPSQENEEAKGRMMLRSLLGSKQIILTHPKILNCSTSEKSLLLNELKPQIIEATIATSTQTSYKSRKPVISSHIKPKSISVTGIEKLMEDPYSYYATYILKLKPLEGLDLEFSIREFGILIHETIKDVEYTRNEVDYCQNFTATFYQKAIKYNVSQDNITLANKLSKIAKQIFYFKASRFESITRVYNEVSGSLEIAGLKVTAIADAIETTNQNTADIIDFKTGYVPTNNDVQKGKKPQLGVEALILYDNGFNIPESKLNELIYLELNGKSDSYEGKKIKLNIEAFQKGLSKLIDSFFSTNSQYFASNSLAFSQVTAKYKKLSRLNEWFELED